MKAKQGFTLVEIMIVVMIIGLLTAIAMPAFQRARRTAQTNTCKENLRQIDSAVQQYIIENKLTTSGLAAVGAELVGPDNYIQRDPECPASGTYDIVNDIANCGAFDATEHNAIL